jgi:hypothetical protein
MQYIYIYKFTRDKLASPLASEIDHRRRFVAWSPFPSAAITKTQAIVGARSLEAGSGTVSWRHQKARTTPANRNKHARN